MGSSIARAVGAPLAEFSGRPGKPGREVRNSARPPPGVPVEWALPPGGCGVNAGSLYAAVVSRVRVLCVGLLTLDVTQILDKLPASNEKVVARDSWVEYGGPAANAAGVAAGLGARVGLLTVAGDSAPARVAIDLLTASGVALHDADPAVRDALPVSTVLLESDSGHRAVVSTNAAAAAPALISAAAIDRLLADCDVVLLDGHHPGLAEPTARAARDAGLPVVFDGGSFKPGTEALLRLSDWAVVSADFAPPSGGDVLTYLTGFGCRVVARSQGEGPIEYTVAGRLGSLAVPAVPVVDTLGAGDVLHGALAYAVGRLSVTGAAVTEELARELLTYATVIGSLSCEHPGARGWLSSGEAIRRSGDLGRRLPCRV